MFVGSCFSENIGAKMGYHKFNVSMNPFGILYNPESIKQCFEFLLSDTNILESDLIEYDSVFHSFYHHSRFSNTNKAELLHDLNERLQQDRDRFRNVEYLFITFGTAWVYKYIKSGKVVSNCHKVPAKEFERYRLSLDEIVNAYKDILMQISTVNPNIKVIFTVSPVRHFKDGAVENQVSKSTLLLAVNELQQHLDFVEYFPAYEIMMDELRDYRFYNSDMLHPSSLAIDYIWEQFSKSILSDSTSDFMRKTGKIQKAMNHRPFQSSAESHQKFVRKQLVEIDSLKQKYSHVNFAEEEEYFNSVLL